MTDHPSPIRAAAGLRTDEFVLRPIQASDAERDYDAVMESRDFLRRWEQSSWPADDFTVEANREDMLKLERRRAAGESFVYTVVDPAGTRCLGCVYVQPTTSPWLSRARITSLGEADWSAYALAVTFWVRKSRLADELDRRLLDALSSWLVRDWGIANHLVVTNEQFEQQVAMIEQAGYQRRFRLAYPNQSGDYLAYAGGTSAAERRPSAMG
jgi:hypothetical protein